MASDGDLAERLYNWSTKEMHFYSHTHTTTRPPTVDDFKVLCRGQNAAIWKWVIGQVHSAETVRTVKGNLALKGRSESSSYKVGYQGAGQYNQERAELLERRRALSREVTATLSDIGHLETDVERVTQDIAETEQDYQKHVTCINDARRKTALLDANSMKTADTRSQYAEYTRRIDSRVEEVKNRSRRAVEPEEYYSRETGAITVTDSSTETGDSAPLETACSKHVRESCETIGSFLSDTLKGTFGGDKTEFTRRKEPLWKRVEDVTSTYSPDQVLTALLANTRGATRTVQDMTARVDIRRDAQNLRFKYEPSGEVKDLSTSPSLLRSVHEILQERSSSHLQRYLLATKCANETRTLQQTLVTIQGQIDRRLAKLFPQKPTTLQVAKSLVSLEEELSGLRACLHCMSGEAEQLRAIVEQSYRDRRDLFTKHHRIQEFQDLTDKKQNLIQVLVKQNINSQSRLDAQISEIEQYVQRALVTHNGQVRGVTASLQDCVEVETKQFASLSLPYLRFSLIDSALKTAVLDLSIHQTAPSNIRPQLMAVLQCLRFPSFQAPETMFSWVMQMKRDLEDELDRLEQTRGARARVQPRDGDTDIVAAIKELCSEVEVQDSRQLEQTLPMLQQKLSQAAAALSHCLHVKDTERTWWEQPGQSCVPWVQVNGHNLQYWTDRQTVLATSLRQLLVQ